CGKPGRDDQRVLRAILAEVGSRASHDVIGTLLLSIAGGERHSGDLARAEKDLTEGLREAQQSKNIGMIGAARREMALLRLQKHPARETLALVHCDDRSQMAFDDLVLEAAAYSQLGRRAEAIADLRKAVELVDAARVKPSTALDRQGYLELRIQAYTDLAANLMAAGDASGALFAADWSKARTLLDALQPSEEADRAQRAA